jgi:ABC-type molybdenum transport system ATPase subunit/photorepair protein PhrA
MTTELQMPDVAGTHVTIRGLSKSFAGVTLYNEFNIMRALATKPEIPFLDESFSALDFDMRRPGGLEAISDAEFVRTKAQTIEIFQREMRA